MTGRAPAATSFLDAEPTLRIWVDGKPYDLTADTPRLFTDLATGSPELVMLGLIGDGPQGSAYVEHLYGTRSEFDLGDSHAVADAVVQHFTGIPMQGAVGLAYLLAQEWLLVSGYFTRHGVDLMALSPRRLTAALYAFVVEHRFGGKTEDADALLFASTPGAAAVTHDGGAGFMDALGMAGQFPGVG